MNMRSIAIAVLATISCSSLGCGRGSEESKPETGNFVSVSVKGTSIEEVPEHIDVIVDNPHDAIDKLLQQGAQLNEGFPHSAYFRGVLHTYFSPVELNKQIVGHEYQAGDVVYYYLLESNEDKSRFINRYALKEYTTLKSESRSTSLYLASARHYVAFLVSGEYYTCAMHPRVAHDKSGTCPKCKMELIQVKGYK